MAEDVRKTVKKEKESWNGRFDNKNF